MHSIIIGWIRLTSIIGAFTYSAAASLSVLNLPVSAPINYMSNDLDHRLVACLDDATLRRYDSRVQYTDVTLPSSAKHYRNRMTQQNVVLSNGTSFDMSSKIGVASSTDGMQVWALDYDTHQVIYTLAEPEVIRSYEAYSVTVAGVIQPFFVYQLARQLCFHYMGQRVVLTDPVGNPPYSHIDIQMVFVGEELKIQASVYFWKHFIKTLYLRTPNITLTFDHTLNHYKYTTFVVNHRLLFTATEFITSTFSDGQLLFSQSSSTNKSYVYDNQAQTSVTIDPYMIPETVNDLISQGDYYYFVTQTSLMKFFYDSPNLSLQFLEKLQEMPENYRLILQTIKNLVYIPSTTSVYTIEQEVLMLQFLEEWGIPMALAEFLTNVLKVGVSAPGGRRLLSPMFYFFSTFDDIFLYQFHDHTYNPTMTFVFEQVNAIQLSKWSMLDYPAVFKQLGLSVDDYDQLTSYQSAYLQYSYSSYREPGGSEGLLKNCNNFFLASLPLVTVAFALLKGLAVCTRNYSVYKLIQQFNYLGFYFIILFDGNIQQFAFYMTAEWQHIFAFQLSHKVVKMTILLFGWLLVFGSVCFYHLCYAFYHQANKVLMDNNQNTLTGQTLLIVQIAFRNLLLGVMSSLLRVLEYRLMMSILLSTEFLFWLVFLLSSTSRVYEHKLKIWVYLMLNLLKILFLSTLLVDYEQPPITTVQSAQQMLVIAQLLVFIFGVLVETLLLIANFLKGAVEFIQAIRSANQKTAPRVNSKQHNQANRKKLFSQINDIKVDFVQPPGLSIETKKPKEQIKTFQASQQTKDATKRAQNCGSLENKSNESSHNDQNESKLSGQIKEPSLNNKRRRSKNMLEVSLQ